MSGEALYLVFVKPGDTLSAIVRDTLGPFRTHQEWMTVVAEVASRSSIPNPDLIFPGQPVILSTSLASSRMCKDPLPIREVGQLRAIWQATPADERKITEEHWDILGWLAAGNDLSGGAADGSLAFTGKAIGELRPPPPQVQIVLREQIERVRQVIVRVRAQSVIVLRRDGFVRIARPVIRLLPDAAANARYAAALRKLTTRARAFKWAGRASIVASVGIAGAEVYGDWDTPNRYRTLTTEGVGLAAGAGSATLSYLACNIALGVPSAGNSLWICAVAGGVVGAASGWATSRLTELAYDTVMNPASPAPEPPREREFLLQPMPLPQLR